MIASACVRFYTHKCVHSSEDGNFVVEQKPICYDIPCHRHADAFYIISQFLGAGEIDKTRTEQGFLTHDGTFLNRYDAMDEAIKCNQLSPEAKVEWPELFSEDLW
jgi:hypothetical protein